MNKYVHGYSSRESHRLYDQAGTLEELLHSDTHYPVGAKVLEAGCGVGAQTVILAANSPETAFTSMDISKDSLAKAELLAREQGLTNVGFIHGDIFNPPFEDQAFDHLFLCFVLEHLDRPLPALQSLARLVKDGGTITVIEGDHGSCYFHPETNESRLAWQSLVRSQAALGGDSLIGRRLCPLLQSAGLNHVRVSPRMVYVDGNRPDLVDGFIRKTIIAMVQGVKEQALNQKYLSPEEWNKGLADLHQTAAPGGTFCYTFFKAMAVKGASGGRGGTL